MLLVMKHQGFILCQGMLYPEHGGRPGPDPWHVSSHL